MEEEKKSLNLNEILDKEDQSKHEIRDYGTDEGCKSYYERGCLPYCSGFKYDCERYVSQETIDRETSKREQI